jgi:hypothetical protein
MTAFTSALIAPASVSLIAHQGGWDEMLFALGPIAVIIIVLAIVKRRVDRLPRPPIDDPPSSTTPHP